MTQPPPVSASGLWGSLGMQVQLSLGMQGQSLLEPAVGRAVELTEDSDPVLWALLRPPPSLSFPGNPTMNPRKGHKASRRAMFNHTQAERQIWSKSAVPSHSSVCRAGLQRSETPSAHPQLGGTPGPGGLRTVGSSSVGAAELRLLEPEQVCLWPGGHVSLRITQTPAAPLGPSPAVCKWGQNPGHFVECSEDSMG